MKPSGKEMGKKQHYPRICHILRMKGEPSGYIDWHEWAEKKTKTHKQIKCKGCGLFHIWKRKR